MIPGQLPLLCLKYFVDKKLSLSDCSNVSLRYRGVNVSKELTNSLFVVLITDKKIKGTAPVNISGSTLRPQSSTDVSFPKLKGNILRCRGFT
jgi:hypothetical protein